MVEKLNQTGVEKVNHETWSGSSRRRCRGRPVVRPRRREAVGRRRHERVIAAAEAQGVRRVVYSSLTGDLPELLTHPPRDAAEVARASIKDR